MATKEEIRLEILTILEDSWEVDRTQIHDNYDVDEEKATDRILTRLDALGVAIKVERDLPENGYYHTSHVTANDDGDLRFGARGVEPDTDKYKLCGYCWAFEGVKKGYQDMLNAGFSAFKPLI